MFFYEIVFIELLFAQCIAITFPHTYNDIQVDAQQLITSTKEEKS